MMGQSRNLGRDELVEVLIASTPGKRNQLAAAKRRFRRESVRHDD